MCCRDIMSILNDKDLNDILEMASKHYDSKKFNAAIACSKKVLEFDDENDKAYLCIGKSLYSCKKYIMARDYFEKLIRITPNDSDNLSWLADTYLQLSEYGKCASTIKKALAIKPSHENYLFISGISNYYEKNLDQAKEDFKTLTDKHGKNYKYWMWLGNAFTYNGKQVDFYSTINCTKTDSITQQDNCNYVEALEQYKNAYELLPKVEKLSDVEKERISSDVEQVKRLLVNSYIFNKKYEDAVELSDEIIKQFGDKSEYFIVKANAYNGMGNHDLEKECYDKARSCKEPSLLAVLRLVELHCGEKINESTIFENLSNLKNNTVYSDEKYMYILKHIIDITKEIALDKKGEVRYHLLCLVNQIIKIKSLLKYPYSRVIGKEIAHYTKINTLKCLLGTDDVSSKFRLQNVAYMNDPSEGEILWKLLDTLYPDVYPDELPHDTVLSNSSFTRNILEKRPHDKSLMNLYSSNTYLASFSEEKNKLPLWTQYADDGKGCCIVFDSNFFDDRDESFVNGSNYHPANDKQNDYLLAEEYCLYRICYVDDSKDKIEPQNEDDKKISVELKDIIKIMKNLKSLKLDEIMIPALNLLDQIRYLFKSKDYEHEKELRIVKFPNKDMIMADSEHFRVPHLYIEINKEIKIKEVVLGPKTERMSEIAPFVLLDGKVELLSVSDIQYQ